MTDAYDTTAVGDVRKLVTEIAVYDALQGTGDDEPLLGTRLVDSLTLVAIVSALERRFGITVAPKDLLPENFRSISDMARFVSAKQAGRWP